MVSISKLLAQAAESIARKSGSHQEPLAVGVDSPESRDFYPSRSNTSTSGPVKHRDLCMVVLRDTLRMYGIPREWFTIEVLKLSKDPVAPRLQINFMVHHWHEGLLIYAPALQKQFLQTLQGFGPGTDQPQHSVCWKFSDKYQCPFTEIPGPSFWDVPLNQFSDVLSEPVTVPPDTYRQTGNSQGTGMDGGSGHANAQAAPRPFAKDASGETVSGGSFDLPPRDTGRERAGDFPPTIPMDIDKTR